MSAASGFSTPGQSVFDIVRNAVPVANYLDNVGAKRIGKRWHCPLHNDSQPSGTIYKGRFHCFGCDWMGDVIDLEMKIGGGNSRESALRLAQRFGVELPQTRARDPHEKQMLSAARANAELIVDFRASIEQIIFQHLDELIKLRLQVTARLERLRHNDAAIEEVQLLDDEIDEKMIVAYGALTTVINAPAITMLDLLQQQRRLAS